LAPASPPAPSEMISGPDLGAGFLHQLSLDRLGEATTFTHHAQEGGEDAGGPPTGDLARLGFVHPPAPCMFGGPRCWHRRYLLPFDATPRVRAAYQRHRFVLETMLAQADGRATPDLAATLEELSGRLSGPLRDAGIPWYIGGSFGVALAGGGGAPRDIDLGTTRPGVDRIAELLRDFLVEPVGPTEWPAGRAVVGARAFVGSPRSGARVEWAVPLEPRASLPLEEFAAEAGVTRTVNVRVHGRELSVSRPEYALLRGGERNDDGAIDRALEAIGQLGVDRELLDVLLERSGLTASRRADLRQRALAPFPAGRVARQHAPS